MKRITISLPEPQYAWLAAESERAGVSMNMALRAVLDAARVRGWTVEPQPAAKVAET